MKAKSANKEKEKIGLVTKLLNSFARNPEDIANYLLAVKNGKKPAKYALTEVYSAEEVEKVLALKLIKIWTEKAQAIGLDIELDKNTVIIKR